MPNPLLKLKEHGFMLRHARYAARYLARSFTGLAHDYWKDGDGSQCIVPIPSSKTAPRKAAGNSRQAMMTGSDGLWRAQPGEISEKMWGMDYILPGDEYITDRLIRPLGIGKDMSILDLAAGLGGRLRRTAEEFSVCPDGLESDAAIAGRGMEMMEALGRSAAIAVYDPMDLRVARSYDCIIAREIIYRVANKEKFIKSIVACCKPKAQVSFTDYIVNAESSNEPAVIAWREAEPDANPAGLVEMAGLWAKAGIGLRVHDDQTDYYKKEVLAGLGRLAKFMGAGVKPDAATKKEISMHITLWAHRMAAIEAGMKFYRFYGSR